MDRFEIFLERLAVQIRPHFVGIALCSLILLIGAVFFRVYSLSTGCDNASGLALIYQSLAFCLAAVPLFCRAVLPNIDKYAKKERLLERLNISEPTDWIALTAGSHDPNIPYPSFYYVADHDLMLIPTDAVPFMEPWLEANLGNTMTWNVNLTEKVTYVLQHHGLVKAEKIVLFIDSTRVIVPMPTTASVSAGHPAHNIGDYKLAKILDFYYNPDGAVFDTDRALNLYGVVPEGE